MQTLSTPVTNRTSTRRWLLAATAFPALLLIAIVVFLAVETPSLRSGVVARHLAWVAYAAFAAVVVLMLSYKRLRLALQRAARSAAEDKLFAAAMESTLDAVFMHQAVRDATGELIDFRFSYLNRNAESMLGQARGYLSGKFMGEVYPAIYGNGRFECYRRVMETGFPAELEAASPIDSPHPDRPNTIIRSQVVRIDDGVLVTCTDITSERRIAQELKRSEAFNRSIVASSSFGIIVMDLDGDILSVNPAALAMLGFEPEALIGVNITTLHDPVELLDRARQLTEAIGERVEADSSVLTTRPRRGLPEDNEWTYICHAGAPLPVQLRINAVQDADGSTIAFMASFYDLTVRKQTDQYIHHIAHHDPLTGLAGRKLFRERLEAAVEYSERSQATFAVLTVDLDHFKRVNDSLGHANGDVVLREIAYRLRGAIRRADTVARFGGDEFVILLDSVSTRAEADAVARKFIGILSAPIAIEGQQVVMTASIGLSMYPESSTPDELLRHADIALYHGKSLGRNGVAIFTPELGDMLLSKLRMESALRRALDNNEFYLVYQPQVSLTDHRLIGVEALLRWRSPEAGLIMPNVFIPVAEESGLIVAIGAWVLETACREIAALQKQIGHRISVAVNLSPSQVHERNFQQTVESALERSGLAAACLELEITERLLMRDSEEALQIMERVQALGVMTSIDDFGTGFSNMSYITRFKVDRLKIDRSFVSRCLTDANSLAVTTAIIALAHSLDMAVVAEGIETVEQSTLLRDLACDSAQGYLFAKPLSLEDVTAFASHACDPLERLAQDAWLPASLHTK